MKISLVAAVVAGLALAAVAARAAEEKAVPAAIVKPSAEQVAWQDQEVIAFAHFGINTFTDREWGDGKEDPKLFNPTDFDARQWARVCKEGGIRQLILTCKHHDGFCLWPSKYTDHSVKSSLWRDDKGDVVREVSGACREAGIRFGVYLSPWDRHEPTYGDSPRYNEFYMNQLTELLTNYGPIAEVWFDGACGEGPNGKKQVYDFPTYHALVRKLQPHALIFSDSGPGIRWIGNEKGIAGETCWSMIDRSRFRTGPKPDKNYLNVGDSNGPDWVPGECDVSIRPGWFYHASQDNKVKTVPQLVDLYFKSVGRNSVLLLNLPPDRRGLIHETDAQRLADFRKALDAIFRTNLAEGAKVTRTEDGSSMEVDLGRPATFNVAALREDIREGQRVAEYVLEGWDGNAWTVISKGTTIGRKKLDRFPDVTASKVRLTVKQSRAAPVLGDIGLYLAPPLK